MSKVRSVSTRSYRAHRFEILDDGGRGWIVTIRPPGDRRLAPSRESAIRLRNSVPNGLATLLEEARQRVDKLLDGPDWSRAP